MFRKKKNKKRSFFNVFFSTDMIKRDIELNKEIYKSLKSESDRSGFKETFEEAMDRQGLTKKDLEEKHRGFKFQAYMFFLLSIAPLISGIYYGLFNFYELPIIIALFLYFFISGFKNSFHCYQIKRRKLNVLTDFLKNPLNIFIIKKYKNE
tara:strand:- start:253 stop:705 length:453 start_codon:yes stop_codon:yes gene_type:complete